MSQTIAIRKAIGELKAGDLMTRLWAATEMGLTAGKRLESVTEITVRANSFPEENEAAADAVVPEGTGVSEKTPTNGSEKP